MIQYTRDERLVTESPWLDTDEIESDYKIRFVIDYHKDIFSI